MDPKVANQNNNNKEKKTGSRGALKETQLIEWCIKMISLVSSLERIIFQRKSSFCREKDKKFSVIVTCPTEFWCMHKYSLEPSKNIVGEVYFPHKSKQNTSSQNLKLDYEGYGTVRNSSLEISKCNQNLPLNLQDKKFTIETGKIIYQHIIMIRLIYHQKITQ